MYIKINMGYLWDNYGITSYDVPEGSCCATNVLPCWRGNNGLALLLCTAWTTIQGIRKCATPSHFFQAPHACVECHSARMHFTWRGPACWEIQASPVYFHLSTQRAWWAGTQHRVELTLCVLEPHLVLRSWAFDSVGCYRWNSALLQKLQIQTHCARSAFRSACWGDRYTSEDEIGIDIAYT